MLSLSQFRSELLPFFRLMSTTGAYVDVSYKGKVYRVIIEDLKMDVPKRVRLRKRTLKDQVERTKCQICGGLVLNGVCMKTGSSSHP